MENEIELVLTNQPFLKYLLENSKDKSGLIKEIESYNLPFLYDIYKNIKKKASKAEDYKNVTPAICDEISNRNPKESKNKYNSAAYLINEESYAIVILAGGLGTRLGFNGPKGTMDLGGKDKKCLFQLHFEHIMKECKGLGSLPYVFIMTSQANDFETRSAFINHDYWQYDVDKIKFFIQENTPMFDSEFIVQAKSKTEMATSPEGNGYWFKYLYRTYPNLVSLIKWVSVVSIDNALQNIVDLEFIGATILSGKSIGAKVIKKNSPDEKIGTICKVDGSDYIIEYIELPQVVANLRNSEDDLVYSYGVTLNYLFSVESLLQENKFDLMPMHLVKKKANVLESINNPDELISRDCYKFEVFILDQVYLFKDVYYYEVHRDYEFAPIKNRTGVDSLESAKGMLHNRGISF